MLCKKILTAIVNYGRNTRDYLLNTEKILHIENIKNECCVKMNYTKLMII